MNKFTNLDIENDILKGIQKKQFEEMTEVQESVIPLALAKNDIIAQAPTGTGKTIAYTIPVLQNIDPNSDNVQALILAPTRELAVQITDEIKEVSSYQKHVYVTTIYGGEYIEKQITSLRRHPQIIVATPGRLMDHMRRNTINISEILMLVLDEADEMLNMGFREDIDEILKTVESEHQTMLFSATISKDIEEIGRTYLKTPKIVRVNKSDLTVPTISQKYIEVKAKDKIEVMSRIIDINNYRLVMVFCNTKRTVDEVSSSLLTRGFIVEALHGDMKQMQRDRVMSRFRNGTINILVASDVAARGLDIDDVDVVFNYDVPTDQEYYVHRVGRTGRAKREGLAITLVTNSEKYRLREIMAYSKALITKMDVPSLDKVMKVRVDRIVKQALEYKQNKYQESINSTIENIIGTETSASDLISGLIMLQLNTESDEEIKEETPTKKKVSRLFISLGRKDNLKIYNLTDMLVNHTNLTNADINNVDMHENFTFFEIPTKFVDEVLYSFSTEVNGRKVLVEEAKEKPKYSTEDKPKRRSSDSRRYTNEDNKKYRDEPSKSGKKYRSSKDDKPKRVGDKLRKERRSMGDRIKSK